jgi:acetyltransferase
LSAETFQKLDQILPPYWSKRNPIDMLGEAKPALYRQVVEICLNAKEVNGLLIISAPQALSDTAEVAAALVDLIREKPIPIITSWVGGTDMQKGRDIFNQVGIPTFDTPERAVRAFMDIYRFSKNIEMLQQIPSRLPRRPEYDRETAKNLIRKGLGAQNYLLTELEAKALLSSYGIPVNRMEKAVTKEEVVQKAQSIGFPVVMKINSREITHKSDANAVFLNLKNENDASKAFDKIIWNAHVYNPKARIAGVTIQPMLTGHDHELILGVKKDRDFGPVILFGMGGVYAEVLQDRAIAFPPLNRLLANRLMEETKVYRLLRGYRHTKPANLQLLEETLIRLA